MQLIIKTIKCLYDHIFLQYLFDTLYFQDESILGTFVSRYQEPLSLTQGRESSPTKIGRQRFCHVKLEFWTQFSVETGWEQLGVQIFIYNTK